MWYARTGEFDARQQPHPKARQGNGIQKWLIAGCPPPGIWQFFGMATRVETARERGGADLSLFAADG